jgi:hypothetical protein
VAQEADRIGLAGEVGRSASDLILDDRKERSREGNAGR